MHIIRRKDIDFKNLSDVITNYASLLTQSKKRLEEEKRLLESGKSFDDIKRLMDVIGKIANKTLYFLCICDKIISVS